MLQQVGQLLMCYRFLGSTARNNSTRITVVRKADPGGYRLLDESERGGFVTEKALRCAMLQKKWAG